MLLSIFEMVADEWEEGRKFGKQWSSFHVLD